MLTCSVTIGTGKLNNSSRKDTYLTFWPIISQFAIPEILQFGNLMYCEFKFVKYLVYNPEYELYFPAANCSSESWEFVLSSHFVCFLFLRHVGSTRPILAQF